jgi:hypothetical protein
MTRYDGAAAGGPYVREGQLGEQERAGQVHPEHPLPVRQVEALRWPGHVGRGGIHQDPRRPQLRDHSVERR